jgi:hypothetical protein
MTGQDWIKMCAGLVALLAGVAAWLVVAQILSEVF